MLRFTVRRPARAEVSPCCHRPSGGDVACGVDVGVARTRGAVFALEYRLALAVLGRDVPARRASLRRVRGRDLFDPTKSFVLQTRGEQSPSAAADTAVEAAFLGDPLSGLLDGSPRTAGHRPHFECFDSDRVEPACDIGGGLFDPVFTPVGLPCFEFGDRAFGARASVGATLRAGQALLQHPQPFGLTAAQTGGVQHFTGGQGCRDRHAAVDTDHGTATRPVDWRWRVGERQMPTAGPIAGDPVGLRAVGDRARATEPHPADLRHPHPPVSAVELLDVMRFDRYLPEAFVHTGFAPRRATVRPAEKIAHGLGEITQGLLLDRLRASSQPIMRCTCCGQLSALLVVAGRAASRLPMLLLLNRQIPHKAGVATMLGQPRRLLGGRKQPVSRHIDNVTTTTDKTATAEAAFPPPAKARGFHTEIFR